ncbi:DnaD domain protein [Bacillus sp. DJP31]
MGTIPSPNPYQLFEKNGFGTLSSCLAEKIEAWCNDQNDELVIEAMKLAL